MVGMHSPELAEKTLAQVFHDRGSCWPVLETQPTSRSRDDIGDTLLRPLITANIRSVPAALREVVLATSVSL